MAYLEYETIYPRGYVQTWRAPATGEYTPRVVQYTNRSEGDVTLATVVTVTSHAAHERHTALCKQWLPELMRPAIEIATADEVRELEDMLRAANADMTTMTHDETTQFLNEWLGTQAVAVTEAPLRPRSASV